MNDERDKRSALGLSARWEAVPPRWHGVLTAKQIAQVRSQQIPVAFDPVQIGWIATDRHPAPSQPCRRDPPAPLSWRMAPSATTGLTFRRWHPSDLAIYRALLNDPSVWHYMIEDWPGDISDAMALDLIAISSFAPHHDVRAVLRDGVPLGQVRLAFAEHGADPQEAEISYWLGRRHWGQGLGKRIVATATQQAFADHCQLLRIVAYVHPDNHASARILEHAGYEQGGYRADGWHMFWASRH